jgi:hypothetical protein
VRRRRERRDEEPRRRGQYHERPEEAGQYDSRLPGQLLEVGGCQVETHDRHQEGGDERTGNLDEEDHWRHRRTAAAIVRHGPVVQSGPAHANWSGDGTAKEPGIPA